MRRIIPAILLIAVLAIGGGIIASTAYQAGLQTAVTTTAGGTVVAPVVIPAYGYGWHGFGPGFGFGFGFLGFLGTLLFVVIVVGLIRAIVFGGRGRHGHWGDRGSRYQGWRSTVHHEFEDWHREAHDPSARPSSGPTPPDAPAG